MSGRARRAAAPVLVGGIAAAALTAVATAQPLARADDVPAGLPLAAAPPAELPLASALSLVVLAAWGVALVTRRHVRRAVLVLGLVAGLGVLAALATGIGSLPDEVRAAYAGTGLSVEVGLTAWFPAAVGASSATVVALVLAVRLCPAWPEMGARYDAPATARASDRVGPGGAARPAGRGDDGDARDLDTWRALDEGRDPTEPES